MVTGGCVTQCFRPGCGQDVYRESAYIHQGMLFCDLSCQQQFSADIESSTTCSQCQKVITESQIFSQKGINFFCSRLCETHHENKPAQSDAEIWAGTVAKKHERLAGDIYCDFCGSNITQLPGIIKVTAGTFCSDEHHVRYQKVYVPVEWSVKEEQRVDLIKPDYYHTTSVYEPFKIIRYYGLNFFEGNVLKYLLRAGKKNSDTRLQDLQKAATYLADEIEETKKEK